MKSSIEKSIKKVLMEIHRQNMIINADLEKEWKINKYNKKKVSKPAINLRELNKDLLNE